MRISSWFQVLMASRPDRVTIRVALSRTAAISARLTAMFASPGDDEPMVGGGDRDPFRVRYGRRRDRAGLTTALVQNAAWIAGVGDVVADLDEEFAEAEDVGVDVVADVADRGFAEAYVRGHSDG